jgi:hypothetical protein
VSDDKILPLLPLDKREFVITVITVITKLNNVAVVFVFFGKKSS